MTTVWDGMKIGLILIVLLLAFFGMLMANEPPKMPELTITEHSRNHGEEAELVANCNDIWKIFGNSCLERLNILKDLGDGRTGNQVIQPCKSGKVIEVTVFIFSILDRDRIENIMKEKGCVELWP